MARVSEATPARSTGFWLAYACCALDDENLACMYHPCSQNMLLSFDLLILILSWISSPVWGSRKQMTRNSGEVPKKVPTHCLRRRDISCLLPSLQQSLWIAHLLEDMGSIFSQGSSHTIFTPLRGTILPSWCCRVSPASVFGCPQGTPCPLIGVMLLGTAVSA